ncbi:MAG: type II toxin-antitoxin system HicB family antitoxin [Thermoleophilia bacterium]|nr:type II toxin-antitoxin system HicB family antitoxin [Thermoleophilia bacterium]
MELNVNVHLEDGSYWADVPELPGCFAAGDTLDELFSSLKEGIGLYLKGRDENDPARLRRPLRVKSAVLSDVPV